jgi:hypothetical protein
MRTRRIQLFLLLALLVSLLTPSQTLACACCANDGEYYRSFSKFEAFQRDLMKEIRFDSKALLFSTEAGADENGRGISDPKDEYELNGSLANNSFRLTFRDGGKSGMLTLPLPMKFDNYRVDLRDGQLGGGGGPLLYKEWRFEGVVNGTGLFKHGMVGPTKYFLVLQGRGNNCDNREDFTNWRLEISGRKARYAFYGKLVN